MIEHITVSYAQNREDLILQGYFPDVTHGVYVDVGANHPIKDSVTKLFYNQGWRGINIEPNASLWRLLSFDRPNDTNLNVGVSNTETELTFTEYANHGLSTFSVEMRESYKGVKNVFTDSFREYKVPVSTLKDIFYGQRVKHIHFMKVDVEGFEYEVLEGNDWQKYRPEMICIESNHIVRDWRPMLKEQGYTKVFFDGLNDYYLARESMHRADFFNYPKKMLESGTILLLPVKQQIDLYEQQQELNKQRVQRLSNEKEIAEKQVSWYEQAPLRWMLRKTALSLFGAINSRMTVEARDVVNYRLHTVAITQKPKRADFLALTKSYKQGAYYTTITPSQAQKVILYIPWMACRVARKAVRMLRSGV